MDKLVITDVHTNVCYAVFVTVACEEYQVAGLKLTSGNVYTVVCVLHTCTALDAVSKLSVNVVHKTGAVKACCGRRTAVNIFYTKIFFSCINYCLTF